MPVTAKICGLTDVATLDAALAGNASHVGLVMASQSPRAIDGAQANAFVERTGSRARTVGLFTSTDFHAIVAAWQAARFDVIQLHGPNDPPFARAIKARTGAEIWQALPIRTARDRDRAHSWLGAVDRLLYDAKPSEGLAGGHGLRFDWTLLAGFHHPLPWVLAGGLDSTNVAEAVRRTGATLVDVSSGVERVRGVKDVDKIADFLQAVATL